jgi:multidrug efflux system membrane fusion protein
LFFAFALIASACADNASSSATKGRQGGKPVAFPVETERVESRRVEYQVTAVGSVEAFETVQVTARVAGVVERVHFIEGEIVKADKVLIEIEPERFRLAVASARAALTKAEAAKVDAEASLARREAVNEKNPGLIIGEEIETFRTRVQTASAELSQARAELEMAELNLRDAFVRAPVAGTIQTRTVQTGEYVQPGKVLATLIRREPLLLRFRVPEHDSTELRPGMRARFTVRGSQREYSAVLTHVAGAADPASRMVAVTAEVKDPNRNELRPGSFAEVRVPLEVSAESPVIPQTAIRPSERGFLAFVVEEGVAKERVLTLGMRTAEGRVEVRNGIQPGEVLVVRGAEALREGVQVRIDPGKKEDDPVGGSAPESGEATAVDPRQGGQR